MRKKPLSAQKQKPLKLLHKQRQTLPLQQPLLLPPPLKPLLRLLKKWPLKKWPLKK
jgi:hypothetical protein